MPKWFPKALKNCSKWNPRALRVGVVSIFTAFWGSEKELIFDDVPGRPKNKQNSSLGGPGPEKGSKGTAHSAGELPRWSPVIPRLVEEMGQHTPTCAQGCGTLGR